LPRRRWHHHVGRGGGREGGRGGHTVRGRGGIPNVQCHNCDKWGHFHRECWSPGGGTHGEPDADDAGGNEEFPGVDDRVLCCPPRPTESRERILTDGTNVKWCSECSY